MVVVVGLGEKKKEKQNAGHMNLVYGRRSCSGSTRKIEETTLAGHQSKLVK